MDSIQQRLAAITPATDRMETLKTIGLFLAAYWFFDRLRDSFAEAV